MKIRDKLTAGRWARPVLGLAAVFGLACATAVPVKAAFVDVLDIAADTLLKPETGSILGLARAGSRIVGVGLRGLVITSDDNGQSWTQMPVPVQSDLTTVFFQTPQLGWAVGHDGLILKTTDAGSHWSKILDGRVAEPLFENYYKAKIAAGAAALQPFLDQTVVNYQSGPSLPYLGIQFDTPTLGYAVGAFGMISITRDGGTTWQPDLEDVDNPQFLNLNTIAKIGSDLYIAGEQGSVYRLDRTKNKFVALPTGYTGSFFGIIGDGHGTIIAYGLRGTIYRSADQGAHWTAVPVVVTNSLTGGTLLDDGTIVLVNMAGQRLVSHDHGTSFHVLPGFGSVGETDVLASGHDHVIISSLSGMAVQAAE